jgi:hypothetical protein
MTVAQMREIREPLCPLRLAQAHQVGNSCVDIASLIPVWILRQMTQDRVMEGCLRRQCGVRSHRCSVFPLGTLSEG